MPRKGTKSKALKQKRRCDKKCRFAEYYDMQQTFDSLYQESRSREVFTNLMPLILSRENILLAYRNIRANEGSGTAGVDGLTMSYIEKFTPDEVVEKVRYILAGGVHGYRPKPVRRVDIPKESDPTRTRPLGIPCIMDRLVQQCVLQILEPICEAQFSKNSYGFRPNRSVENAIASVYHKLNRGGQSYVIEFDIKSFFDCVDHSKLVRQLWTLGIRDTTVLYIIRQMLKAPIRMPDGRLVYPDRGTPQGGIISPLLANVCLNELDHWVESQWECHPLPKLKSQAKSEYNKCSLARKTMRAKKLKEMYIVRYADDFRIFCKDKKEARRIKEAVTQWLSDRLHLEVSPEKTRIVNVRKTSTHFLGFKIKLRRKGNKWVIRSHVDDRKLAKMEAKLVEQAKRIARPRDKGGLSRETALYNSMVMGEQNYYRIASEISIDMASINHRVMNVLDARMGGHSRAGRLRKTGRKLKDKEKARYGGSKMLRFDAITKEPIYPIGYVKFHIPRLSNPDVTCYSAEGRQRIHDDLRIKIGPMLALMRSPPEGFKIRGADACISKYSAQWGQCAISKESFESRDDIVCHLVVPKEKGGTECYRNIILVTPRMHSLLIATTQQEVDRATTGLCIDEEMDSRLNYYRKKAGLEPLHLFS